MPPKRAKVLQDAIDKHDEKPPSGEKAKKSDLLNYITCVLCRGLFRDAHTINECLCTFCKVCIY